MYKKIMFLSCLCLSFVSNVYSHKYELSIGLIFKNEAPYLQEWIEYHKLVGVQHFYLFNNDSTDNFEEVLAPYIRDGIVELDVAYNQPDFNGTQVDCYNRTIQRSHGVSKWVAFIDSDEFLTSPHKNIAKVLAEFEEFGGVVLNWRVFGTSNVKSIPKDSLMIECLTRCSLPEHPMNTMVKSIVRPERSSYFSCPHFPIYVATCFAVNTSRERRDGPYSPVKYDKLWINHYWTRDQDYFSKKKIPRRVGWGDSPDFTHLENELNATTEKTILNYVPTLRYIMRKGNAAPQKNEKPKKKPKKEFSL